MTLTDIKQIPARIQIMITIRTPVKFGCFELVYVIQSYHMHAN